MESLLVICGPTATGKTALGIRLAKKFEGEIISADSRQVYRGMDIGTGKDLPANSKFRRLNLGYYLFEKIPVWLLDVVYPNQEFSVSHYYRLAWEIIRDIWQRGKSRLRVEDPRRKASGLPILVGGTGFYIKAVVDGIPTKDIPRNPRLRKSFEEKSREQLLVELETMAPFRAAAMNVSDRANPRRLVRAIEVARWQQENRSWSPPQHQIPDVLFIGLTAPYRFLYARIDERIESWVKQGAEEEIKKLLKDYRWETSVLSETLGYKEWRPYFEDKITFDEVIRRWKFNEHHYARRQMTWFKKDKRIHWFDISQGGWENKIEKLVFSWYTKT